MAALLGTTLAALLVPIKRGASCGHDLDFHLLSWVEVAASWRSGLLTPHWLSLANYGAGEPRLIFYPPLSWMLGAALGSVFPWSAVPILFTGICLLGAGAAMYRLARRWLSPGAATAAGCLAIANPYTLFVAYERTAYGELLAATLVPLALLYAVEARPRVAALALAMAGTWLGNAPSGLMLCYALLCIALLRVPVERKGLAGLRLGAGTALGLGLAGCYLVPATWQQRWVEIARAVGPGARVEDNFLFGRTGDSSHDAVLHTVSWIACLLMAILVASLPGWWRAVRRERGLQWLAMLAGVLFLLLLPASAPVWRHLPRLNYLQFSWRWLTILGPIAMLMLAGALAERLPLVWRGVTAAVLCMASIVGCSRGFYQWCDDDDVVRAQVAQLNQGRGEAGADEYTPRGADNAEVAQELPAVRVLGESDAELPAEPVNQDSHPVWQRDDAAEVPVAIHLRRWEPEHRDIMIDADAPGYAVLRLMDFHDWRVVENGRPLPARPQREDGMMTIPVARGRTHIEITWQSTRDVWVGRAVTLLALCCWVWVWAGERRWRALSSVATAVAWPRSG
jgi:hypothetical protein